jgi:hypothetical protein
MFLEFCSIVPKMGLFSMYCSVFLSRQSQYSCGNAQILKKIGSEGVPGQGSGGVRARMSCA